MNSRWRSRLPAVLIIVLSSLFAGPLRAEDSKAIQLFNMASELAEKGRFKEAIEIWQDCAADLPLKYLPVVQTNLAMAYQEMGRTAEAWHHAYQAKKHTKGSDASVAELEKGLAVELLATHTKVLVFTKPEDGQIFFGEMDIGPGYSSPLYWWFEPGKHKLYVTHPGNKPRNIEITVKRGVSPYQSIKVDLETADAAGTVKKPADSGGGSGDILEWSLLGGGTALIIGGGVFTYLAYAKNEDLLSKYPDGAPGQLTPYENREKYDAAYDDEVVPKQIASYALFGVGIAAAVTGGVLLLLKPVKEEGKAEGVQVVPMVVPGGGGVVFRW